MEFENNNIFDKFIECNYIKSTSSYHQNTLLTNNFIQGKNVIFCQLMGPFPKHNINSIMAIKVNIQTKGDLNIVI